MKNDENGQLSCGIYIALLRQLALLCKVGSAIAAAIARYISITFQMERNMIVMTFILLISNQREFHFVLNQRKTIATIYINLISVKSEIQFSDCIIQILIMRVYTVCIFTYLRVFLFLFVFFLCSLLTCSSILICSLQTATVIS